MLVSLIALSLFYCTITLSKHQATDGIQKRIDDLKSKLASQSNANNQRSQDRDILYNNYEYIDDSNQPITPIMDSDKRKQKGKFKLRQLKTTKSLTPKIENTKATKHDKKKLRNLKQKIDRTKVKHSVPVDVFYRRQMYDENKFNVPTEWVQCQDLITPYFTDLRTNLSSFKRTTIKGPIVLRLIQLLSINVVNQTKEDVYSVMYQISNLQIRLFQWDIAALKLLFNVIMKGQKHTFTNLKYGVKAIFNSWSLDLSNTTNLLRQTRIFRPPCIVKPDDGASTLSSKPIIVYTKSVKPTKYCDYEVEDCSD